MSSTCQRVIREDLLPVVEQSFAAILESSGEAWSLTVDKADPQTVLFKYPRVGQSSAGEQAYVQPSVRLELGARSDHWPAEDHVVQSYAAEEFPARFDVPQAKVRTLAAERTFWEKATILHALHHRHLDKPLQSRLSRHYYDMAQLCNAAISERAVTQVELLASVVRHKQLYFGHDALVLSCERI